MDSKDHETGNAQKNSSSSSDIEEVCPTFLAYR